jgi:TonB family protein
MIGSIILLFCFMTLGGYPYLRRIVLKKSEHRALADTPPVAVGPVPEKSSFVPSIAPKGNDALGKSIAVSKAAASRKPGILRLDTLPENSKVHLYKKSNITQNVAPEEMWKRVTQCVFPSQDAVRLLHTSGVVSVGLVISPDGDVTGYRVLNGEPPLQALALDVMSRWKFRPNVLGGVATTYSRVRTLVHFSANGTTSVDFAQALVPDDLGDRGASEKDSTAAAVPRPLNSPNCSSGLPSTSTPK